MTLWKIESLTVWHKLQQESVLRARREHIDADFLNAYDWLRGQMTPRIGPPPEPDVYPMWAYFQFASATKRRPDLRRISSGYSRDQTMVLVELGVEESRVLLSDYHDWHYVLNDQYFPVSLDDFESFASANHDEETARQLKLRSWPRIFDLDFRAPEVTSPRDEKTIQATFWELRLEDVASLREFRGRGNPKNFAAPE